MWCNFVTSFCLLTAVAVSNVYHVRGFWRIGAVVAHPKSVESSFDETLPQGENNTEDSDQSTEWIWDEERGLHSISVLLVPAPFSTVYSLIALAEELQSRGHRVKVGTLSTEKETVEEANLKFLDLGPGMNVTKLEATFEQVTLSSGGIDKGMGSAAVMFNELSELLTEGLEFQFPLSSAVDGEANEETPEMPHVIVFSTFCSDKLIDFATRRKIPTMMNIPSIAMPPVLSPAIYVPVMFSDLPLHGKSTFQRVVNVAYRVAFETFGLFAGKNSFLGAILSLRTAKSLTLVNSVPGLDYPAHLPPLVQYTGPLISAKRADYHANISPTLMDFIDHDTRPVVYVSMGTVARLSPAHVALLVEALYPPSLESGLKQWKVVWALPEPQQKGLPEFVREATDDFHVAKWIETPSILVHVATKIFVSHCGGNGSHESIALGVPLVCIPFFGDQPEICLRVERSGAGVCIRPPLLKHSAAEIRGAIIEVLTNSSYSSNVGVLGSLMERYGGVERAADWVEFVAEVKGDLSLLETPVQREGIIKAACLDIIFVFVALVGLGGVLMGYSLRMWSESGYRDGPAAAKEKVN